MFSMQNNTWASHISHTQMATQLSGKRMSGFSLVDEEIVQNILSRLPALTFAYAACVNKRWYKICSKILKRPKLASALSLNPFLHVSCFTFLFFLNSSSEIGMRIRLVGENKRNAIVFDMIARFHLAHMFT
jgi:hypothetical protein